MDKLVLTQGVVDYLNDRYGISYADNDEDDDEEDESEIEDEVEGEEDKLVLTQGVVDYLNDRYGISYADNDEDDDEEDESEIEDEVEGEEGLDTQDGADEAIKMGSERVRVEFIRSMSSVIAASSSSSCCATFITSRKNHSVTHSNAFIPPQSEKICLEGLSLHAAKRGVSHSFKVVSDNNNGGSFIARRRLDITTRIIGASKTIRLSCC
ncbi:unnamed protein product [Lupinus luteus]|uniref:Uncharacterized protein n=1 Tax=Lupinus luteus TaxID=3873 RepID=A0AAV1WJ30_LUPLU